MCFTYSTNLFSDLFNGNSMQKYYAKNVWAGQNDCYIFIIVVAEF